MRKRHGPATGFTLIEIMVVVVIVGLLAAMAMQTYRQIRVRSLSTILTNDFRIYSGAFETFNLEEGRWPAEAGAGVIPVGMEQSLTGFEKPTALLGNWDWDYQNAGVTAGLSLVGSNASDKILLSVDQRLDDGNLATGRFRRTGAGSCTLIFE